LNSDVQSFVGLLSLALLLALVMLAGFMAIPVGIGGGIFYYWFYKSKQSQREDAERAAVQALRRKIEAADYLTETEFREAVYEKLEQDIYLDEAIGEMYEWEALGEPPKFPEVPTPIEIGRYKDQAAHFLNNAGHSDLVPAVVEACRPLVNKSEGGVFQAIRQLKLSDVEYLAQRFEHQKYFKKLYGRLSDNQQNARKDEVWEYIKDTPFELIKERPISISLKDRFSHTHILGSVGAGKTQLIQYLITKDLEEDCCIIVIDNQQQMLPKLANLDADIQYISPHDPLEINLFDMTSDHSTTSLLRFVLSGIMDVPLTKMQNNIFQFATELVIANRGDMAMFRQVLEGNLPDLSKIDDFARNFFEGEYRTNKEYQKRAQEIGWRITALLSNPVLRKMFSAKKNKCKLDLSKDMILIDTDVDLLQDASGLFGRFFIAQLLQAAHSRFKGNPRPVYIYIDEFYFYVDEKLASMLETARKAKMGLTLANHLMAQINDPKIASTVMALTSTKFASNLEGKDLQPMAQAMRTTKEFIQSQKKGHFALYQNGQDTVSIEVEFGYLENIVGDDPDPPKPEPVSDAEEQNTSQDEHHQEPSDDKPKDKPSSSNIVDEEEDW